MTMMLFRVLLVTVAIIAAKSQDKNKKDLREDVIYQRAEAICPCTTRQRCPHYYGSSPFDIRNYGALPPCITYGRIRCCSSLVDRDATETGITVGKATHNLFQPARFDSSLFTGKPELEHTVLPSTTPRSFSLHENGRLQPIIKRPEPQENLNGIFTKNEGGHAAADGLNKGNTTSKKELFEDTTLPPTNFKGIADYSSKNVLGEARHHNSTHDIAALPSASHVVDSRDPFKKSEGSPFLMQTTPRILSIHSQGSGLVLDTGGPFPVQFTRATINNSETNSRAYLRSDEVRSQSSDFQDPSPVLKISGNAPFTYRPESRSTLSEAVSTLNNENTVATDLRLVSLPAGDLREKSSDTESKSVISSGPSFRHNHGSSGNSDGNSISNPRTVIKESSKTFSDGNIYDPLTENQERNLSGTGLEYGTSNESRIHENDFSASAESLLHLSSSNLYSETPASNTEKTYSALPLDSFNTKSQTYFGFNNHSDALPNQTGNFQNHESYHPHNADIGSADVRISTYSQNRGTFSSDKPQSSDTQDFPRFSLGGSFAKHSESINPSPVSLDPDIKSTVQFPNNLDNLVRKKLFPNSPVPPNFTNSQVSTSPSVNSKTTGSTFDPFAINASNLSLWSSVLRSHHGTKGKSELQSENNNNTVAITENRSNPTGYLTSQPWYKSTVGTESESTEIKYELSANNTNSLHLWPSITPLQHTISIGQKEKSDIELGGSTKDNTVLSLSKDVTEPSQNFRRDNSAESSGRNRNHPKVWNIASLLQIDYATASRTKSNKDYFEVPSNITAKSIFESTDTILQNDNAKDHGSEHFEILGEAAFNTESSYDESILDTSPQSAGRYFPEQCSKEPEASVINGDNLNIESNLPLMLNKANDRSTESFEITFERPVPNVSTLDLQSTVPVQTAGNTELSARNSKRNFGEPTIRTKIPNFWSSVTSSPLYASVGVESPASTVETASGPSSRNRDDNISPFIGNLYSNSGTVTDNTHNSISDKNETALILQIDGTNGVSNTSSPMTTYFPGSTTEESLTSLIGSASDTELPSADSAASNSSLGFENELHRLGKDDDNVAAPNHGHNTTSMDSTVQSEESQFRSKFDLDVFSTEKTTDNYSASANASNITVISIDKQFEIIDELLFETEPTAFISKTNHSEYSLSDFGFDNENATLPDFGSGTVVFTDGYAPENRLTSRTTHNSTAFDNRESSNSNNPLQLVIDSVIQTPNTKIFLETNTSLLGKDEKIEGRHGFVDSSSGFATKNNEKNVNDFTFDSKDQHAGERSTFFFDSQKTLQNPTNSFTFAILETKALDGTEERNTFEGIPTFKWDPFKVSALRSNTDDIKDPQASALKKTPIITPANSTVIENKSSGVIWQGLSEYVGTFEPQKLDITSFTRVPELIQKEFGPSVSTSSGANSPFSQIEKSPHISNSHGPSAFSLHNPDITLSDWENKEILNNLDITSTNRENQTTSSNNDELLNPNIQGEPGFSKSGESFPPELNFHQVSSVLNINSTPLVQKLSFADTPSNDNFLPSSIGSSSSAAVRLLSNNQDDRTPLQENLHTTKINPVSSPLTTLPLGWEVDSPSISSQGISQVHFRSEVSTDDFVAQQPSPVPPPLSLESHFSSDQSEILEPQQTPILPPLFGSPPLPLLELSPSAPSSLITSELLPPSPTLPPRQPVSKVTSLPQIENFHSVQLNEEFHFESGDFITNTESTLNLDTPQLMNLPSSSPLPSVVQPQPWTIFSREANPAITEILSDIGPLTLNDEESEEKSPFNQPSCRAIPECIRRYGDHPLDACVYGFLPLCREGYVRCLDNYIGSFNTSCVDNLLQFQARSASQNRRTHQFDNSLPDALNDAFPGTYGTLDPTSVLYNPAGLENDSSDPFTYLYKKDDEIGDPSTVNVRCVVINLCILRYGSSSKDVEIFGYLPECPAGEVRCLDSAPFPERKVSSG